MKKGIALVNVIVFAAVAITVLVGLVNWGAQTVGTIRTLTQREQADQIAEAGIEYYRWHLAHFPTDYTDGTTTPGPYIHPFDDAYGNQIGQYSLTIIPPTIGSTLVTVKSTGTLTAFPTIQRTIQATLGKPSFAKYAFAANDFMRFGSGTVVNGPIYSNDGIHFDGVALNTVSSALATTTDPDNGNALEWSVFTKSGTADPQPYSPAFSAIPQRTDVFVAGRQISQPNISFSGITADISTLQGLATSSYNIPASGAKGYEIVFSYSAGTTTYKLYKVTGLASPNGCTNDANEANWGAWSTTTETAYPNSGSNTFHLPANGVIFVNDNVWVSGTVGHARITIVAGKLPQPATPPDIIVNNNLKYTYKDGTDVIGLISQGNISVGLYSLDNQEIDAAMVAQNGRIGRFYYNTNCHSSGNSEWHRTTLTIYGMIATFIRYGFTWTGINNYNCGGTAGWIASGYCTRNITYDPNLLYGPPPSFPLSSSQYVPLLWQEL